ncbi:HD domain-containing protein [Bradyrhizobium sp. 44]|uniref:HD-GYP domain-containing protein n=1 Tax=Bradyrhizobium sp. 44 TaxID=2782675 RepID=UPI001FFAF571|nr:HD domain-containing phosphohydrolase [Bradyrhizobium sp. 44]MCK1283878.1 HD domain-containing protein [Bradyrhizobium sp. 44]
MLEHKHVECELLSELDLVGKSFDVIVIDADLRVPKNILDLKALSNRLSHIPIRIFLVDRGTRLCQVQALALGATHVLFKPVEPALLLWHLSPGQSARPLTDQSHAWPADPASQGAASIASMFSAVLSGGPIDLRNVRQAGEAIAQSVAEHGLADWLNTVRRHHEGTYQHCLLVTGIAVDFGLSLGMKPLDIERLHTAAMFHDIGKARVPLAILDKPGKLDDSERALIETHPEVGYEALKSTRHITPEILDAVRHHHEYLDGSGYPDGLCGDSIADIVRMLTISDIFAALIEQRAYKRPMPRDNAYDVLRSMKGRLEKPLVDAFRPVALHR